MLAPLSNRVAALLKRAEPGAELACRAHEKAFVEGGMVVPRGVISYYAGMTLPGAHDLGSWLQQIQQRSEADVANGVITAFYQPILQITGNDHLPLPGAPE